MHAGLRGLAALIIVLPVVALTGCLWSAGNERPISLTVKDGEYLFHWCGKPTEEFQYLQVSYATYSPQREDALALRARGEFSLQTSDEFSLSDPPLGLAVEHESAIPIESSRVLIFLDIGRSETDLGGINATFRPEDAGALDGRWLYPSGAVHDSPCEMRGAL